MARNTMRSPEEFTFNDIANMYFDACVERYLKKKYKDMTSWQYAKRYTSKIQSVGVMVNVGFSDGNNKQVYVNMLTLLDAKADSKDVIEFCEEKKNDVKAFIRRILIMFSDNSISEESFDVSSFTEDEVNQVCDVLTDEGLRVFVQEQKITVQRM